MLRNTNLALFPTDILKIILAFMPHPLLIARMRWVSHRFRAAADELLYESFMALTILSQDFHGNRQFVENFKASKQFATIQGKLVSELSIIERMLLEHVTHFSGFHDNWTPIQHGFHEWLNTDLFALSEQLPPMAALDFCRRLVMHAPLRWDSLQGLWEANDLNEQLEHYNHFCQAHPKRLPVITSLPKEYVMFLIISTYRTLSGLQHRNEIFPFAQHFLDEITSTSNYANRPALMRAVESVKRTFAVIKLVKSEADWKLIKSKQYTFTNMITINLDQADLHNGDFTLVSLPYSSLVGCNLDDTNFQHSNLTGTDFTMATLNGANLSFANATNVNFESAELDGASLEYCDLNFAWLYGASFKNANLRGAKLGAFYPNTKDGAYNENYMLEVELDGADLTDTRWFYSASLSPSCTGDILFYYYMEYLDILRKIIQGNPRFEEKLRFAIVADLVRVHAHVDKALRINTITILQAAKAIFFPNEEKPRTTLNFFTPSKPASFTLLNNEINRHKAVLIASPAPPSIRRS